MNGHGSMNRIFRVVWNATLGVWQVASELARSKGKTKSARLGTRGLAKLSAGSILVLCHAGALAELPTGGQVTAGSGTINDPVNGHLVVNQSSDKMAIDWQSFSVGTGNTVQFIQPSAEAIALNRVLGGDPSVIRGTISANGRVVLLNPNGILFGPTSKVEVASLLASTLNMSNEDFMAGNFRLEGDSRNAVVNQGQIKAADGGFVALVAAKIENVGDIRVRGGEVLMGSGRKVRLDLGGPIKIEIDEAVVDGYIKNGGLIKAEGGTVVMTVKTAGELASFAINNEGIIEATSLARGDGGTIRLLGDGGTVANSGTLDASSVEGKGGTIEVTGARVGILDGSVVDASGATGGGTVLLGGDYQGKNAAVQNAKLSFVGTGATVRANATRSGNGGKVIVWADERTQFGGTIEAKGGAESGNGGFVEVSGKNFLDFQGAVDTSAANGRNGTLLLDPTNLTIGNVGTSAWITNQSNTFGDFTADANPNPAHDFSFLRIDVLLAALANNDITVQSACDAAACVGNITVIDAITWNSGKALTLNATGGITINADINSTGAPGTKGGDFNAIAAGGDIRLNANITTHGGTSTGAGLAGGNVTLNAVAGSVILDSNAVISTDGSAAAAGSNAAGGAAGAIALNSTTGITLNDGDLLARGGTGDGSGAAGVGGLIGMTSTTGQIQQGGNSQIVGADLQLQSDSGSVNLNSSNNAVERIAAESNTGSISFRNRNTAALTVADIGGVSGVSTGGAGSISLTARNLMIDSAISSQTGAITLNANNGQQSGDFSGVVVNGTDITTQGGNISISGRGGDAAGGNQSGVVLANGATVNAGGSGSVTLTGIGGSSTGNGNHGVVIEGNGSADSGTVTSAGGQVTVNATGGAGVDGSDNNHALVFRNNGQIGTSTSNHAVTVRTTVGAGDNSVAYASDAAGGYIGTGSGNLTLEGNVLSVNGGTPADSIPAVAVRSTGHLTVRSQAASFTSAFSLNDFASDFVFNDAGNGLDDVAALTIGKSGNTSEIAIDKTLAMSGKSVTLTGGNIKLDADTTAGSLTANAAGNISLNANLTANSLTATTTANGNIVQDSGSFTLGSANLNSASDITLNGTSNQTGALTATAVGTISFNNGANHLNLNGTLAANTVQLTAGSLSQFGGSVTANALAVTTTTGGASLGSNNKIGTLAANVNGDLSFNNGGSTSALVIGSVGDINGVTSGGAVTLNGLTDLDIAQNLQAASVTVNAGARSIDLGTETAGKISLTDAEIDRITATSLTLNTSGNVANTADVRAASLSAMTINAGQGITNSGSGQLGFSGTDAGKLTLTSTGTADNTGVGTAANRLVTVGASELVLNAKRDILVDARTRAGGSGSANLDKLHINSTSAAASNSTFSVLSTAGLSLTTGAGPSWYRGENPSELGTYHISLSNADALDFKFVGNAPIRVAGVSNIGAANFGLESLYGINVANAITGTSGTISLKANASSQGGNFIGVNVGAAIQTANGSIVLDGRGGTGRNGGDFNSDQSNQYGVNVANTLTATNGGTISITGYGGSSNSNGANHDGVVISSAINGANGTAISIYGDGGSGDGSGTTSDGVAFVGTGAINNAGGSVKLSGASGSGYNSHEVEQQGTGIITAAGLEVVSGGRVKLTNDNNVGTLAGDIDGTFDFDNGGRTLIIGTVNERVGISPTSSGNIRLHDLTALQVNESLQMNGGSVRIAADSVTVANGKTIGNVADSGTRNVQIVLTSRSGGLGIDVGSPTAGKLAITADLLQKLYGANLELLTSGSIAVTANTEFTNLNGLTLTGGAITNTGGHYLRLASANNQGSVALNGSSIGANGAEIITRGANSLSVSSGSNINVKAYTDDTGVTELIQLRSLAISSGSGGATADYLVEGAGLNYSVAGTGSSYAVHASAVDTPVDFSFTGNASVAIDASSDTKGGSFDAWSTAGNVTVNDGVTITAGSVGLDAANAVTVGIGATINSSGSAWLEGDNAVTFNGTGALTAANRVTLRTTNGGGTLTTGSGLVRSTGSDIEIEADNIALGSGGLTAATDIKINTVTDGRGVTLGGGGDGSTLSLTTAEVESMNASRLVVGRNAQNDSPGAITLAGAINLTGKVGTLSLNGYNSAVTQLGGANLTVDTLNVSLNSGGITLNQANAIRNFQASTNGAISLTNTGALDVKGVTSRGGTISVTTSGDMLVSSTVSSVANSVTANGASINLESSGGKLTVLGNVSANGYVYSGAGSQDGGAITLRGQNVELGVATISSNGTSNSTNGATGGDAGSLTVDATAGVITLDGTTINLTGGSGGLNGQQGNGSTLTFSDAVVLGPISGSTPRNVSINVGGGNVNFNSTVNGGANAGNNLTISSSRWNGTGTSRGNVTFAQAVGATNAIGNLTLNNVQNINLGAVRAAGIAIGNTEGTTTLSGVLNTSGANGISINSTAINANPGTGYTTTNGGNVVLATKGSLTLADTSVFNSSGNIDLKADGGITLSGTLMQTTGAGIVFRSNTTLASDLAIDTTADGASGGNVEFHGTLNSSGGARDLTITAGTTGNVSFSGQVGNTAQLDVVTIQSANNVTTSNSVRATSFTQNAGSGTTTLNGTTTLDGAFGFAGNALTINQALTATNATVSNAGQFTTGAAGDMNLANGFVQNGLGKSVLSGDINTTGTNISFAGPVEFGGTMKLDTGAGAGNITFGGTLDAVVADNANTVTLNAGTGAISFAGNVGATRSLGHLVLNSSQDVTLPVRVSARSLSTNAGGSTILQEGAVVTTSTYQSYGDAVTLAGDASLSSTGNANIAFAGTVSGAHDLAVNTSGTTTFTGPVNVGSLATDAGGTTVFNGGAVTTSGSQTYGDNVQLGANTTFTSTGGNAISFGGTVNSDSFGNYALTVDTTGTTSFNGAAGATRALESINVSRQQGTLLMNGGSFRTTGAQTYQSGTIVLGGNTTLMSTGAGAITLNGNVDAAICTVASLDVQTQGATVFGGAIGTYRPLWSVTTDGAPSLTNTVNFNNGTIITLAEQTYGELAILGANTTLKSLGQGDITFNGPVRAKDDGVQSLTVDTSGDIVFNGAVGDNNQRLASFDAGQSTDGKVQINGGGVTTSGTQVYRQQVALGDDTVLTGTTGTFNVGIDGQSNDLTLRFSGPTELEGSKFVGVRNLVSDGTGVTKVSGTVATSGTQTYDSNVVLTNNAVLKSTGNGASGDISLNGTVDGAHSLRIETEGNTDLAGTVGGTTALTSLSTDGPGVTTIGANVRTTGAQQYGDAVQVAANATLSSTQGGNVSFAGTVDGPGGLTVNTTGATTFNAAVGGTSALASLTTDAGGSVAINGGSVTTTGAQTFGDAVTLGADTTLVSTSNGAVRFNGTLDGAHTLNVNTGGSTTFAGPVGATSALTSITTDGPGLTTISGGTVRTTGAQTYGDGVTLGGDTTLTSTGNGNVAFGGTVNGPHNLTVNTGGTTEFDGEVGGTSALASLTTDGAGNVKIDGGGITTTGAQTYGDAVTLGANAALKSTQDGNIVFSGTVNGPHQLDVRTGGTTRFDAAVGGTAELASLTTGGNGTVSLNGGSVKTSGGQHYENAVNLGADTVLASSHGGDIRFGNTLDGAHKLAVETSGTTTFDGAVGGKTALTSITTDADGAAVINGGLVRTSGEQKFNDGVMIGKHTTFAANGPITFNGTLDGPWDVTINTPSVATFGGAVGGHAPIRNLNGGKGTGTFEFKGPSITATGTLTLEEAVHVKNKTVVKVGGDALFYGDAKTGKDLLAATAGGRIQFGRPVDNFKNYLPTLFAQPTQPVVQVMPTNEVRTPVSVVLADNASSRQISAGNLQVVNVNVPGKATQSTGEATTQDVSESAVNQAVGQIAADESSRSTTYVVTVQGGVRVLGGVIEEQQ